MINIWKKIYSGKVEFITIVLFVVFTLIALFARKIDTVNNEDFFQIFINVYLTFFPFTIPVTLYPIVCILRKRVPRKIILDKENESFTIEISHKDIKKISFDNLGYAMKKTNLYSTLIIYEKVLIRGMVYDRTLHEKSQYYFKKVIDLEAPILTLSWSIKELNNISKVFEELNISKITPKSKKPFLLRLLEK